MKSTLLFATTALLVLIPTMALADTPPVPEVDPASIGSTVVILGGLGFILRERLRRR